jgi:hypothetical protein
MKHKYSDNYCYGIYYKNLVTQNIIYVWIKADKSYKVQECPSASLRINCHCSPTVLSKPGTQM